MIGKPEIIRIAGQVNLNPHVVENRGNPAFQPGEEFHEHADHLGTRRLLEAQIPAGTASSAARDSSIDMPDGVGESELG